MPRVLPAVGLFLLAPLVGEFLLGNLPIASPAGIPLLLAGAPLYGGGALLIREIARRCGYGWPTIIVLALAYGVVEEAFSAQTLFNPDWADHRILDFGYIPALGTSPAWTLFVLGLHTVWSISVPIAIVETLAGARSTTPWLGRRGLTITAVLFTFGVLAGFVGAILRPDRFVASVPQYIGAVVAAVVLVTLGVLIGRRGRRPSAVPDAGRTAPHPWLVGIVALSAGSVFMLLYATDPSGLSPWLRGIVALPPWLVVALYLALYATVIVLATVWSRRSGWTSTHRLALAGGALLTYAWTGFPWVPVYPPGTGRAVDLIGNTILAVAAIALLAVAAGRLRHRVVPQTRPNGEPPS